MERVIIAGAGQGRVPRRVRRGRERRAPPLPGGLHRFVGVDPAVQDVVGKELSFEEFRSTAIRIAGVDFGMRDPVWLSRFGRRPRREPLGDPGPHPAWAVVQAALIRPDGHVWWAGEDTALKRTDEAARYAVRELGARPVMEQEPDVLD